MPGASIANTDGKTVLTISQSWLSTYMDCPEAARHVLLQTYPEHDAPEALFGTHLHAACDLHIRKAGDPEVYLREAFKGFVLPPPNAKGAPHKWDTSRGKATWTMTDLALDCFDVWLDLFWENGASVSKRGPGKPEFTFERLIYDSPTLAISLRGQVDYHLEGGLEVWDWKNSARKWEQWEVDRYDIQSTSYGIGLHGLELPGVISFNFGVTNPDNFSKSKVVTVTRDQRHVDTLLEDTIIPLAKLIQRQPLAEKWPALSASWKCSPKWCDAFQDCRGRHGLSW